MKLILDHLLLALTDLQVDHILRMIESGLHAFSEAVKAIWLVSAPFLIGYLAYRQAKNRKALDENTKVNTEALDTANSHNAKIAKAVEISERVLSKIEVDLEKVPATGDAAKGERPASK